MDTRSKKEKEKIERGKQTVAQKKKQGDRH